MKPYRAAGVGALLVGQAAFAQGTDPGKATPSAPMLRAVVVIGTRASLESAQDIKRDRLEIVDSVVADDINKLPDISVVDALLRVTGVQMTRDRGEGTGLTLRGFGLAETTLNGREIFTAGNGRSLDFADIPSELLAGIDVYKTSSADHIEGGLTGRIDLRTRRPFDFKGREIALSARQVQGELVDRSTGQFSALLSNRWKSNSAGEFGALLHFAHQKRAWREDQKTTGNPVKRTDIVAGQTVYVPTGSTETTSVGERERTAASLVLQWRPQHNLELYAEGFSTVFKNRQDSYQLNASASSTFVDGSATLFPGTSDIKNITWTNAPVSVLSFARDILNRTQQAAVGGTWTGDALTVRTDLSLTKSRNTLFFSGFNLGTTAANFSQDLSTTIPSTSVSGTHLLDPASYQVSSLLYRANQIAGRLPAAQLDAEYSFSDGFIESVSAGIRWARRSATNAPGLIVNDPAVTGVSAADRAGDFMANPYTNYFPGTASIGNYLVADLGSARDAAGLRTTYGVSTPIPTAASALSVWNIQETTQAAYTMARFKAPKLPLDGNLGLRLVHTRAAVSSMQSDLATGGLLPINIDRSTTDALPSVNLRYQPEEGWVLRAAASRTITRPDFSQLSPSLTLNPNSNPLQNAGSAGNPALKPIRAKHLDLTVERYINRSTSVFATGFWKKVDGLIATLSATEVYDGSSYQVSRPYNSLPADVRGLELGYQQFYDHLPSWLRGLGLQANYTLADSQVFNTALGTTVPLQNLSRHSVNLVGMLERGPLSVRIAYNWRSRFNSGTVQIVGIGPLPIYTRAYDWLDASVTYRVTDKTSITLAGTNLLKTVRSAHYGSTTRPQSSWTNDRQIFLTATARF